MVKIMNMQSDNKFVTIYSDHCLHVYIANNENSFAKFLFSEHLSFGKMLIDSFFIAHIETDANNYYTIICSSTF